ncbi:reverse transcriptase domain-containing protein [Tanacetum coccineum]
MPTWCHMFNSTLTGNARVWFDDLPQESIDSYDDLKKTFLENYLHQKKCIKDPVEIHNIKQRDGESMEEFVRRGDVAASNREQKKSFSLWKQQEVGHKQNFKKGGFRNQQRLERKQDMSTLLTKTPKEISALDKGKFKPPLPMTTPVEKRNAGKFYEFHGEGDIPPMSEDGTEGPMIIEVKMGGHFVHHMYLDGGSSSEILRWRTLNFHMDEFHGRKVAISIQWNHRKARGGTVTLQSSKIIPLECTMVSGPGVSQPHNLNIHEGCLPVRQKKKGQAPKRNKAIYEEVEKLVDAGIMKEVNYHSWLSNSVMVKKHDSNGRMCVDFKDLNKACPKDGYPLPEID